MNSTTNFLKTVVILILFFLHVHNLHSQYQFKIIVDNNQIWRGELPSASKLACDGIWSIPGNSGGDKGRAIPIAEWQVGFDAMGTHYVVTEDYWKNYPTKNHDLTKDIVGKDKIVMVCGYAEPSKANDDHVTAVINDDVIDDLYTHSGKKVIVLARAYTGNWKTHVQRALNNNKVGGVCFEQKPDETLYKNFKIIDGLKATLSSGRSAYMLLPPHFASNKSIYSDDLTAIFNLIKSQAPEILDNPNLYFVPNCYNRQKDKTTTMYGGDDSVEGAIKKLKELRNSKSTSSIQSEKLGSVSIYPTYAHDFLTVEIENPPQCQLFLYDMLGKCHIKQKITSSFVQFNIKHIQPGTYSLVIYSNNDVICENIVVY